MPKPSNIATTETESIPLRPVVREVLNLAKRPLTFDALHALMRVRDPGAKAAAVQDALEWNFRRGHVNFEHNSELAVDVWSLTLRGKQAA